MTAILAALATSPTVIPDLTVVITPSLVTTVGSSSPLTTASVTAVASVGSGSYTYAWTILESSSFAEADSPAAATTTFTGTVLPGQVEDATFRCTATDTVTAATGFSNIYVQFIRL